MKQHSDENTKDDAQADDEAEGKAYDLLIENLYTEVPADTPQEGA
jgi:hypothetical protein